MKKFLALTISALLCLGAVAGCQKDDKNAATESTEEKKENVIATIGEFDITSDVLNFYLQSAVNQIQQETGSEPGWEDIVVSGGLTAHDAVITKALEYVKEEYSLILEAKSLDLYSDERNEKFINSYIEYYFGGEDYFNQTLAEYGYDYNAAVNSLTAMNSYQVIAANEYSEADAESKFEEIYNNGDYYMAKHILITFEGRDDENQALEEANKAYERATNGENFEDLIEELGEDPGQDAEYGYMFTDGEMVDEFENAVKNLKAGEISKPVKTDYGYHVIKRYDIPKKGDALYDEYVYEIRVQEGAENLTEEKYNAIIDKYKMDIDDSKFGLIDLSEFTTESATE